MTIKYLHLLPESDLPDISRLSPFRMIVLVEEDISKEWRGLVSTWIVKSGCLYMMAWGKECSIWDDLVDWANMEEFNFYSIQEDKFVMTTWHENDSKDDVFFFSKNNAFHPTIKLKNTVILDISEQQREKEILALYTGAKKILFT